MRDHFFKIFDNRKIYFIEALLYQKWISTLLNDFSKENGMFLRCLNGS
ncbi:hypothetical protein LEP1GSC133_2646 [Leptospira borgpetersenii serovar Pomona str. 200901868]|uniref:Uncharacterized protein n=1 Tax=Leptospira borgpetersenii serovar Pomona str. 200901868 TaxID=1192866 RepID=M6W738_LEPBO|nr:hypothetical protein LEP1GSC133_2646 [Leptospira borgpetersenii serovar Pomona str. 200901868]